VSIDPKLFVDVLALLISVGACVYAFFVNRRKDVDQRFTEGSRRMDRIDARVAKLESALEAMPGKDDVHSLRLLLADMGGEMKAIHATMGGMSETMKRLENSVARHDDHLRNGT
jgi:hypothetical protein